jgi:hypothetical protein
MRYSFPSRTFLPLKNLERVSPSNEGQKNGSRKDMAPFGQRNAEVTIDHRTLFQWITRVCRYRGTTERPEYTST